MFISTLWNRLVDFFDFDPHGAFFPAPDIQKKLEEKGYSFKYDTVATTQNIAVPPYQIISPGGSPIMDHDGKNEATLARYLSDYEQAAQQCSANKPPPTIKMKM